jgi:hypothetical protein
LATLQVGEGSGGRFDLDVQGDARAGVGFGGVFFAGGGKLRPGSLRGTLEGHAGRVLVAQGICLVEGHGIVDGAGTPAVGLEYGIQLVGPRARKQFHRLVHVGSGETHEGHKSH